MMSFGRNIQYLRNLSNMTQEILADAIHIERPFENPFTSIPNAYKTLGDYMRLNGLVNVSKDVIPCFETDGDTMDVYIACE